MENSPLAIFDEIWPKTMYYSTGSLARFWSNFKKCIIKCTIHHSKAIKYYQLTLCYSPDKFDSWAGLALAKSRKITDRIENVRHHRV